MKKVLLLGDSIRMGYDDYVKELLKDEYEVYYDPDDNGRFASYTLWQLNQMICRYGKFDLVHWNNGYWDMNIEPPMTEAIHPNDEYLHFFKRIIKEIRKMGAKIIFATTTPILTAGAAKDITGTGANLRYHNDWVIQYNKAAKKLMQEENIPVNDLYARTSQHETFYKSEDRLHLTDEGYRVCAQAVANAIRENLK